MTAETVREASIAVARAEHALAAAQAEFIRAEDQSEATPAEILAVDLHRHLCHWDHTDGCGWEYEITGAGEHSWGGMSHERWLAKAKSLLTRFPNLDVNQTGQLLQALREL